eukprot:gene14907-20956_t
MQLTLLLALVLAPCLLIQQSEAGAKAPPLLPVPVVDVPKETFEIECTVIFFTGQDWTLNSFGFSSGPVQWDGIAPLFFTLWDFSKIEVGFVADDQIRSYEFQCTVDKDRPMWTNKELQEVIELRLYAWPFRKDNGGLELNYYDISCKDEAGDSTICTKNMRDLPGMDRKASAAAILFNFPDFDPSKGRRPPPPPMPPAPPQPPHPPIPPPPPPESPPPPYVLKHKPGYRQRPVKLRSPSPPQPPPPFRPPPPFNIPPPSPPTTPDAPDSPYFPIEPIRDIDFPPYQPFTPYYPPPLGEVDPPESVTTSDAPPPVYGSAAYPPMYGTAAYPPMYSSEAIPPSTTAEDTPPEEAPKSPELPYVPYAPPPDLE